MGDRHPQALLAALLAHPERVTGGDLAAFAPAALVAAADRDHVVPLASRELQRIAPSSEVAAAMHAAAAVWTLREAAERVVLGEFLDAAAGVPMVFFKGASTAYSLYPSAALRMKEDWDVLVAPGARRDAAAALARAGFAVDRGAKPGRVRMRQQSWRRDVAGGECIVDLHTRVLNPPALADVIPYRELIANSVALPALHPSARGLGDEAALALACLHRLAHHSGEPRLAWDVDVLLLVRRMRTDGATRLIDLTRRWQAGPFVASEVTRVAARFDERLTADVADAIGALAGTRPAQAAFLREGRTRAQEFAMDWRVLGWRDRAALLRETLAPDAAFMRASTRSRLPLPVLYLKRIALGAAAWFRRA